MNSGKADSFFARFLFTADIPAVLSSLMLVAFYHLEILKPKRLRGPKLDALKIPAAITIVLLFVLQLVVFTVVNTGNDISNSAIIIQAVVSFFLFSFFLDHLFLVSSGSIFPDPLSGVFDHVHLVLGFLLVRGDQVDQGDSQVASKDS